MKTIKHQRGFLLVIAILIIVLVALMASVVAYMYTKSSEAKISYTAAKKSLYIAESGIDRAVYQFLKRTNPCTVSMSGAQCCSALQANDIRFADGKYNIISTFYNPTAAASLSVPIAATGTVNQISMSSIAGYAPSGRVILDAEAFDYNGVNGTTLLNVRRAVAGTVPAIHTASPYTTIRQAQCSLRAIAGVPDLVSITSSIGRRTATINVMDNNGLSAADIALCELVGRVTCNKPIYIAYRTPNQWFRASEDSGLSNVVTYSITRSPNGVYGWVVGSGGNIWFSNLVLWSLSPVGVPTAGSETWHHINQTITVSDLYSVTPVGNTGTAWAVGNKNCDNSYNIVKIVCSGPTCVVTKPNVPVNTNKAELRGVSMNANGSFGMAVNDKGGVLQYVNGVWSNVQWGTETPNGLTGVAPLTAVKVIANNEVWVNGDNVYKIVPSSQSGKWKAILIPGVQYNFGNSEHENMALLIDGSNKVVDGWIVGQGNHIVRYVNGSWINASYTGMGKGEGVGIISSYFAAAVGGGHRLQLFNGATWQNDPNGGPNPNWGSNANQISLIKPFNTQVAVTTP